MTPSNYVFWTCPNCRHVRDLDMDRMTNRCARIDQGESPVAGAVWEYQDHDRCPAFEPGADRPAPALLVKGQSTAVFKDVLQTEKPKESFDDGRCRPAVPL